MLDEQCADLNMRRLDDETMLMKTAQYGGAPVICTYLLENGADKTLKNAEGKTAYEIALLWLEQAKKAGNKERIESLKQIIELLE